ncbi:MAG: hypothetical protein D6800_07780 [Candidatus Zixiibacteriota bacterium]|nr:MAG: hypothetical protein D6800_07780 [candidate division Zixibacteria bacterium]
MDSFEKQVPPRRGRHTLWLLLGLAAGMAVGAAIDNMLLGILVGLGFAVALGSSLTQLRRVWRDHQERLHHGHR